MRNLIGLIDAICDAYDRNDFKPGPDGTHCNEAVQAIGASAFSYNGFRGMNADQMMQFLDEPPGDPDWQSIDMALAQDMANSGNLVVAGLKSTELRQGHGHIVVIRPGLTVDSGKWGHVPRCVNIGASDFIARAQTGPVTGSPVGVNDAFVPKPRFYVLRSSL